MYTGDMPGAGGSSDCSSKSNGDTADSAGNDAFLPQVGSQAGGICLGVAIWQHADTRLSRERSGFGLGGSFPLPFLACEDFIFRSTEGKSGKAGA